MEMTQEELLKRFQRVEDQNAECECFLLLIIINNNITNMSIVPKSLRTRTQRLSKSVCTVKVVSRWTNTLGN